MSVNDSPPFAVSSPLQERAAGQECCSSLAPPEGHCDANADRWSICSSPPAAPKRSPSPSRPAPQPSGPTGARCSAPACGCGGTPWRRPAPREAATPREPSAARCPWAEASGSATTILGKLEGATSWPSSATLAPPCPRSLCCPRLSWKGAVNFYILNGLVTEDESQRFDLTFYLVVIVGSVVMVDSTTDFSMDEE